MLTKLCRKFGYDAIQKLVPEGDERLVSHIKKEKARQDKRAKAAKAQSIASSSGGKRFDELVDSDDEYIDSDDDMTIGGRTMSMKSMGAGGSIAGRSIAPRSWRRAHGRQRRLQALALALRRLRR
jgi:hypothetical protein